MMKRWSLVVDGSRGSQGNVCMSLSRYAGRPAIVVVVVDEEEYV